MLSFVFLSLQFPQFNLICQLLIRPYSVPAPLLESWEFTEMKDASSCFLKTATLTGGTDMDTSNSIKRQSICVNYLSIITTNTWNGQLIKRKGFFQLTVLGVSIHDWLVPWLWAFGGFSWWKCEAEKNHSPHGQGMKERGTHWVPKNPSQRYIPNDPKTSH